VGLSKIRENLRASNNEWSPEINQINLLAKKVAEVVKTEILNFLRSTEHFNYEKGKG
jgi:hypothetical protein